MTSAARLSLVGIFLFGISCRQAQPPSTTHSTPSKVISPQELLSGQEFGPEVSRVAVVSRTTCLVLESNPARLQQFSLDGGLSVLAIDGPGPAELDEERYTLSRLAPARFEGHSPVLLHSLRERWTLAIPHDSMSGELLRFHHDRPVLSIVSIEQADIASVYTSTGPSAAIALGGDSDLATLKKPRSGADGLEWPCAHSFGSFAFSGDAALDVARSYYSRLLRRDASSFYQVRLFGHPTVRVYDTELALLLEFEIPRGGFTPDSSEDGASLRDWRVLQDADVDDQGRLHALRGVYSDDNSKERYAREILVFEPDGTVSHRFLLTTALVAFGVDASGSRYFGVEAESHRPLQFDLDTGVAN